MLKFVFRDSDIQIKITKKEIQIINDKQLRLDIIKNYHDTLIGDIVVFLVHCRE